MKRLQRAIRPTLLTACVLLYLVFIFQFAQYHYRLHVVRTILADIQTLQVGRSTRIDAAEVTGRYPDYLYPLRGCNNDDCSWGVIVFNGVCGETDHEASPWVLASCKVLDRFNESATLNLLGIRYAVSGIGFRTRDGLVKTTGAWVFARGSDRDWPPIEWEFLPDSPEPWMTGELSLYHRHGDRGKRGWVELITPSMPEDQRLKAFGMVTNCLDSLSGCFSLKDRLRGDAAGPAGVARGAWRIRRGPTANATIFCIGLIAIGIGSICLWASRAKAVHSSGRAFVLMSTGVILLALGVASVYITQVADDVSLWVWLAAAVTFIVLARFIPPALQPRLWRFPAYGSVAVFVGSLLGGLVELDDFAGLIVVAAVLVLWGIIALQTPNTVPEKVIHGTVWIAALMFNIALYPLSRLQVIDLDDGVVASLKMPLQHWVALPEWFDRFEVDIWLKVALITSFFLVGLLSAAFFIMRGVQSRRAQALAA